MSAVKVDVPDAIYALSTDSIQELLSSDRPSLSSLSRATGCSPDGVLQFLAVEWFRRHPWEWFERAHNIPLWPKQVEVEKLTRSHELHVDAGVDVLFGGARGPGKSHWAMCHLTTICELYPKSVCLMVRSSMPDLYPARDHLKELLRVDAEDHLAVYNSQKSSFTFPNKSVIYLRFLNSQNVSGFKSASYTCVAVEELTEVGLEVSRSLLGALRNPLGNKRVIPHAIATTNPDGADHLAVKEAYVSKRDLNGDLTPDSPPGPGIVWGPPGAKGKNGAVDLPPPRRVFVQGLPDDNPSLSEDYKHNVAAAASSEAQREAWLKGDWEAMSRAPGAIWGLADITYVDKWQVPTLSRIGIYVDTAFSKSGDLAGIMVIGVGPEPICSAPSSADEAAVAALSAAGSWVTATRKEASFTDEELALAFSPLAFEEMMLNPVIPSSEPEPSDDEWNAYVLEDLSRPGIPSTWMPVVVDTARKLGATIVFESNMAPAVVSDLIPDDVRWRTVTASMSKEARAQSARGFYSPVIVDGVVVRPAKVFHVRGLTALESQMQGWDFDHPPARKSPDRIDALSHGIRDLLIPTGDRARR